MDWRTLFFAFEDRINRLSFWVGTILLVIVNVVVLSLVDAVLGDETSFIVSIVVAVVLLYPPLAVHVNAGTTATSLDGGCWSASFRSSG